MRDVMNEDWLNARSSVGIDGLGLSYIVLHNASTDTKWYVQPKTLVAFRDTVSFDAKQGENANLGSDIMLEGDDTWWAVDESPDEILERLAEAATYPR